MASPSTLNSPDFLNRLNDAQRTAVCHPGGPLLILAGAGSGKTRVLTHRVAYLLHRGIPPSRIMAVTFTNKAAEEMSARLEMVVGTQGCRGLWLGTFHAICGRILRMELPRTGVDLGIRSNYVILDQDEQIKLIHECLKELNKDPKRFSPWQIRGNISGSKNNSLNAEAFASRATDYWLQVVSEVFLLYQQKLQRNNALDFDDLLLLTLQLVRQDPVVLENYRERFLHLLVDEYQDTNQVQYHLVKELGAKHRNLCVVGDVDQSIYSFRAADYRIILNFERDFPDACKILLQENYRSTQTILAVANHLIENNQERFPKTLTTQNPVGEKVLTFEAVDEQEEAAYVLREVERLQLQGLEYRDIAVLYRTNAQSRPFEEAFKYQRVPYRLIGGVSFYDRKEIKDVLAYLRLLYNPDDALALRRIVNTPRRGIGATTLDKLGEAASHRGCSVWDIMGRLDEVPELGPRVRRAAVQFHGWVTALQSQVDTVSVSRLLEAVLEGSGYWQFLTAENNLENMERQENVRELQAVAREFEAQEEEPSLGTFLTQLALLTSADDPEHARTAGGAVTLMTLHSAKGLEFPVVFLVGMEETLFPHSRSVDDQRQLEEERRLCYVGITRTQRQLYVTWAKNRMTYAGPTHNPRSRFVKEMPEELFAELPALSGQERRPASGVRRPGENRSIEGMEKKLRPRDNTPSWSTLEQRQGFWSMVDTPKPRKGKQMGTSQEQTRGEILSPPAVRRAPAVGEGRAFTAGDSSDPPSADFAAGDRLLHPDHGPGTVRQVIGAEDRVCLAIEFDRRPGHKRIIDPKLMEIHRL